MPDKIRYSRKRPKSFADYKILCDSHHWFCCGQRIFHPVWRPDDARRDFHARPHHLRLVVVATAAAMFERILQNAVEMKSENDLTV